MSSKKAITFFLTAVILAAVFFTANQKNIESNHVDSEQVITKDKIDITSSSTLPDILLKNDEGKERSLTDLENEIDQLPYTDREKMIVQALGSSPRGKKLARMLALSSLYQYSEKLSGILDVLTANYKNDFLQNPEDVSQIVHSGLQIFDDGNFPIERFALISTLSGIPELKEEASNLALSELQVSIPKARILPPNPTEKEKDQYFSSSDPHYMYPIWMYSIYLAGQNDSDIIKKETNELLRIQKDHQVVEMIKSLFQQHQSIKK